MPMPVTRRPLIFPEIWKVPTWFSSQFYNLLASLSKYFLSLMMNMVNISPRTKPKVEKERHAYPPLDDDDYYQETYFEQFRKKGYTTKSSYYGCVNEVDKKRRGLQLSYKTMCDYNYDYDDIEKRWKTLLMGRIPLGRGLTAKGLFVGKKLHPRETTDMGGEDCPSDEVSDQVDLLNIFRNAKLHFSLTTFSFLFSGRKRVLAKLLPPRDHLGYFPQGRGCSPYSHHLWKRGLDRNPLLQCSNYRRRA